MFSSLPPLVLNRTFVRDFIDADTPCFALGLVETDNRQTGFLALRLQESIPPAVSNQGFNFGHQLLGNDTYEVIQFAFEFYGFQTCKVLVNPNNPLVQNVLTTMIEQGDYFFFAIDADRGRNTVFRSELGEEPMLYLKKNLKRIQQSTTSDRQYQKALSSFKSSTDPEGLILDWVCRDNPSYLDLTEDRLELTPAK